MRMHWMTCASRRGNPIQFAYQSSGSLEEAAAFAKEMVSEGFPPISCNLQLGDIHPESGLKVTSTILFIKKTGEVEKVID